MRLRYAGFGGGRCWNGARDYPLSQEGITL
jgi:hypothetical protein